MLIDVRERLSLTTSLPAGLADEIDEDCPHEILFSFPYIDRCGGQGCCTTSILQPQIRWVGCRHQKKLALPSRQITKPGVSTSTLHGC